jgi:hypothetical protein
MSAAPRAAQRGVASAETRSAVDVLRDADGILRRLKDGAAAAQAGLGPDGGDGEASLAPLYSPAPATLEPAELHAAWGTLRGLYQHGLVLEATVLGTALSAVAGQARGSGSGSRGGGGAAAAAAAAAVPAIHSALLESAGAWLGDHLQSNGDTVQRSVVSASGLAAARQASASVSSAASRSVLAAHVSHGRWADALAVTERFGVPCLEEALEALGAADAGSGNGAADEWEEGAESSVLLRSDGGSERGDFHGSAAAAAARTHGVAAPFADLVLAEAQGRGHVPSPAALGFVARLLAADTTPAAGEAAVRVWRAVCDAQRALSASVAAQLPSAAGPAAASVAVLTSSLPLPPSFYADLCAAALAHSAPDLAASAMAQLDAVSRLQFAAARVSLVYGPAPGPLRRSDIAALARKAPSAEQVAILYDQLVLSVVAAGSSWAATNAAAASASAAAIGSTTPPFVLAHVPQAAFRAAAYALAAADRPDDVLSVVRLFVRGTVARAAARADVMGTGETVTASAGLMAAPLWPAQHHQRADVGGAGVGSVAGESQGAGAAADAATVPSGAVSMPALLSGLVNAAGSGALAGLASASLPRILDEGSAGAAAVSASTSSSVADLFAPADAAAWRAALSSDLRMLEACLWALQSRGRHAAAMELYGLVKDAFESAVRLDAPEFGAPGWAWEGAGGGGGAVEEGGETALRGRAVAALLESALAIERTDVITRTMSRLVAGGGSHAAAAAAAASSPSQSSSSSTFRASSLVASPHLLKAFAGGLRFLARRHSPVEVSRWLDLIVQGTERGAGGPIPSFLLDVAVEVWGKKLGVAPQTSGPAAGSGVAGGDAALDDALLLPGWFKRLLGGMSEKRLTVSPAGLARSIAAVAGVDDAAFSSSSAPGAIATDWVRRQAHPAALLRFRAAVRLFSSVMDARLLERGAAPGVAVDVPAAAALHRIIAFLAEAAAALVRTAPRRADAGIAGTALHGGGLPDGEDVFSATVVSLLSASKQAGLGGTGRLGTAAATVAAAAAPQDKVPSASTQHLLLLQQHPLANLPPPTIRALFDIVVASLPAPPPEGGSAPGAATSGRYALRRPLQKRTLAAAAELLLLGCGTGGGAGTQSWRPADFGRVYFAAAARSAGMQRKGFAGVGIGQQAGATAVADGGGASGGDIVFHVARVVRVLLEARQQGGGSPSAATGTGTPSLPNPLAVSPSSLADLTFHLLVERQHWTLARVLAAVTIPGSPAEATAAVAAAPVTSRVFVPPTLTMRAREAFSRNSSVAFVAVNSSKPSTHVTGLIRNVAMALPESRASDGGAAAAVANTAPRALAPPPAAGLGRIPVPWSFLLTGDEAWRAAHRTAYSRVGVDGHPDLVRGKRLPVRMPAPGSLPRFPWASLEDSPEDALWAAAAAATAAASDGGAAAALPPSTRGVGLPAAATSAFGDAVVRAEVSPVGLLAPGRVNDAVRALVSSSSSSSSGGGGGSSRAGMGPLATLLLPQLLRHGAYLLPPTADAVVAALLSGAGERAQPVDGEPRGPAALGPLLAHLRVQASAVLAALPSAVGISTIVPVTGGGLTPAGMGLALATAVQGGSLATALELLDELAPLVRDAQRRPVSASNSPTFPGGASSGPTVASLAAGWLPDAAVLEGLRALAEELREPQVVSAVRALLGHVGVGPTSGEGSADVGGGEEEGGQQQGGGVRMRDGRGGRTS